MLMSAPATQRASSAIAAAAFCAAASYAGPALAQPDAGERAISRFDTYCVKSFPDLDKILAVAQQDGWKALVRASESDRKRPFYSEIWELDDKTGDRPALEIKSIHGMAYCATISSVKEGVPIERFAAQHSWVEDPKAAALLNGDFPKKRWRVYLTQQYGKRVTVSMQTDDKSTVISITHMRATGADP